MDKYQTNKKLKKMNKFNIKMNQIKNLMNQMLDSLIDL